MFKRKSKILISTLLCITYFVSSQVQINAYVKKGFSLSNPGNIKYAVSTTASQYINQIMKYATTWDTYCPEIGMSMGTGENIYFYGNTSVFNEAYATTSHSNSNYHVITFYNYFASASFSEQNEIIVHEVGHALGLAHCEDSKKSISVMRATGFNGKAYPLSDDREGISDIY